MIDSSANPPSTQFAAATFAAAGFAAAGFAAAAPRGAKLITFLLYKVHHHFSHLSPDGHATPTHTPTTTTPPDRDRDSSQHTHTTRLRPGLVSTSTRLWPLLRHAGASTQLNPTQPDRDRDSSQPKGPRPDHQMGVLPFTGLPCPNPSLSRRTKDCSSSPRVPQLQDPRTRITSSPRT